MLQDTVTLESRCIRKLLVRIRKAIQRKVRRSNRTGNRVEFQRQVREHVPPALHVDALAAFDREHTAEQAHAE